MYFNYLTVAVETRVSARKLHIFPELLSLLQQENIEVKSAVLAVLAICTLDGILQSLF